YALQNALAQRDLLHVAELNHLLVDGEESFVEFKPVGIEAIFGPAVIQHFADISNNRNPKEHHGTDDPRSRFREYAGACGHPAKEEGRPKRKKQLKRRLYQ